MLQHNMEKATGLYNFGNPLQVLRVMEWVRHLGKAAAANRTAVAVTAQTNRQRTDPFVEMTMIEIKLKMITK